MSVTRTVRIDKGGVFLQVSKGEYLVYKVTVRATHAAFSLVDSKLSKLLLSHTDAPNPAGSATWQRQWPTIADSVSPFSTHVLGMHFLSALKYTWFAEHHRSDGIVQTVMDIDFESNDPAKFFMEDFVVTTT
jgi:hypothetical protein